MRSDSQCLLHKHHVIIHLDKILLARLCESHIINIQTVIQKIFKNTKKTKTKTEFWEKKKISCFSSKTIKSTIFL